MTRRREPSGRVRLLAARLVPGLAWVLVLAAGWAVTATLSGQVHRELVRWLVHLVTYGASFWFASVAHRQLTRLLDPPAWRRRLERERQESARRGG